MADSTLSSGDSNLELDVGQHIMSGTEAVLDSSKIRNPDESFLLKCMHPPSAVPGFEGLPTNDVRTQTLLQYKQPYLSSAPVIRIPPATAFSPQTDFSNLGFAQLLTNGMRVRSVGFSRVGLLWYQDLANTVINDAYNVRNLRQDAQLYRPVYKSTTLSLNATAFNNTGMVTSCQFNPAIINGNITSIRDQSYPIFAGILRLNRDNYKRCPVGSSAWHGLPKSVRIDILDVLGYSSDTLLDFNDSLHQVVNFGQSSLFSNAGSFVPTASQIMNNSDRSYSAPAKDGAFVVQRLNTVSPAWLPSNLDDSDPTFGLHYCYFHYIDNTNTPQTFAYIDPQPTVTTETQTLVDTRWSPDFTFAWVRFDGLTPQEAISPSITNVNLLIHKYYTGYEVQPSMASPWAGNVKLGPKPNLRALQALMDGMYDLKDCLPACYNFWGVLGNLGLKALKGAASEIFGGNNFLTKGGKIRKDAQVSDKQRADFENEAKGFKMLQKIDRKRGKINRNNKAGRPMTETDDQLMKQFAALRLEFQSLQRERSKNSKSSPKKMSSGPRRRRKPAPKQI
jgi:hypothetical protein